MIRFSDFMRAFEKLPKEVGYKGFNAQLIWTEDDNYLGFCYQLKDNTIVSERKWLKRMDYSDFKQEIGIIEKTLNDVYKERE